MELLSNYFWAAVGISVAGYLISNIMMMDNGSLRPRLHGWNSKKELWTFNAAMIGLLFWFAIAVVTLGIHFLVGLAGATGFVHAVSIIPAFLFALFFVFSIKDRNRKK